MTEKVFDITQRTFNFSIRIVNLVRNLPRDAAGIAIGNQVIRSGTSVGANVEESQNSGTKKEFIHGFTIALKEARETEYWLKIVQETELVSKDKLTFLLQENKEIIRILTTIVKKSKLNGLKKIDSTV